MLGSSALIFWQTKICRIALLHALGRVCNFVLRCKNIYRIGPKSLWSGLFYFHVGLSVSSTFYN